MIKSVRSVPIHARQDGSTCSQLKHFFKCDGLTPEGYLVDSKGGCVAQPHPDALYEYDSTRYAVGFANGAGAVGSLPTMPLVSGSFEPLPVGKFALLFQSGYALEELAPNAYGDGDPYYRTMRVAFGNNNGTPATGYGMSDGTPYTASPPHNSSGCAHAVLQSDGAYFEVGLPDPLSVNAADNIYNSLGSTGSFYRYALSRPDLSGGQIQSAIHSTSDGSLIITVDDNYAASGTMTDAYFPAEFRFHGAASTGIALFYFDAVPTDLAEALYWMSAEWARGNKVIWPYWA